MTWMKSRVRPWLRSRTVSTSRRRPGMKRSSPIRSSGPLATSRMPVASTTRTPRWQVTIRDVAEQRGERPVVTLLRAADEPPTLRGQREAKRSAIRGVDGAPHEARIVQSVYDAGEVAGRHQEAARQLDEGEPARLPVELVEDVELRERAVHPNGAAELTLD